MKAWDERASGEPTLIPAASNSDSGQRAPCSAGRSGDCRNRAHLEALGHGERAIRLVVVMMLGMCVPLIATSCADAAGPVGADTDLSSAQEGAEAEAADAASEEAPPPPAPAKATGELTDDERRFQGAWQLDAYEDDSPLGTMRINNRDFHADGVHGRYVGYVSIRSDTSPAQVDFTIEDCEGNYKGMTSTGIYYEEDDGPIVFAGPAPGDPRPKAFTEPNEMWRMRPLDPATEGDGEKPR